ncbi:hypothetical protein JCM3775_000407 [Rhodotorula graminis]|uniref:Armadillo-like helical domain-containing protein n=1 Tax=Rhodotorula graminis (strain WP1) TaxID=578459 RepID=A0A194SAF3_RHOGW|nr:uncharacterized protein RHOBADRAFT_51295 [Rhodotorula graminis WP1]KPV77440.1 hypothetical protein RHOBADRAFT_51295 [Rhodotorula graminis WP1]
MASPPLASPLKQVNTQGKAPPSKLEHSWHQLAHNPLLFTQLQRDPRRWFADLFCLKPSLNVQQSALDRLSPADLAGPYQHNVSLLFSNAVDVLKSAPPADVTRSNAIETLIPFCRNVLGREYPDQSEDVLSVLAGSVERRDQVFTDFVSAIDLTLQDSQVPLPVRHRTLQLALVVVASVNQGALGAFFLRRDLFSTLVSFIADRETQHFTFEATLLLGLLANYHKAESRNPYGVRIEDFVEEGVMERIIDVASTVCLRARDAYVALADDTPASFAASLSSLVWSTLRLGGGLFSGGLALPPPPPPPGAATSGKGKEKAVEGEDDGEQVDRPVPSLAINGSELELSPAPAQSAFSADSSTPAAVTSSNGESSTPVTSPPLSPRAALTRTASSSSSTPTTPTRTSASRPRSPRPADESPFAALPPEPLVLLVPFFELLNSNKTFCTLVFASRADSSSPPLSETLISLTSYVVCHAAGSARARLYARLCLVVCMILVEEGEGKLCARTKVDGGIRLCRQRNPMLPQRDDARAVPLSAMIDSVVVFLRHNLHKRLDVETYAIALRLLQRIFQQLKAEKVRLARDWVIVWRAMLSLASFVVSHSLELRSASVHLDTLISQLFVTLSYATYWAAQLLPSPAAQAELFYEILHADATLSALSDLLGISSIASPVIGSGNSASTTPTGTTFPPALTRRETPTRATFFASLQVSPSRPSLSRSPSSSTSTTTRSGSGAGFVATECISNLRSIVTFFSGPIDELRRAKKARDDEVDPDEIIRVIRHHLGGVELIESAAMGDLPRYGAAAAVGGGGGSSRSFIEALGAVACRDTLELMKGERPGA